MILLLKFYARYSARSFFIILGVCFLLGCSGADFEVEPKWQTIFDGKTLEGWSPKIADEAFGQDKRNTFRIKNGAIVVDYSNYSQFDNSFGNLFYEDELSDYRLKFEYRFVGEQVKGGADWAILNSGVMLFSQAPETMRLEQGFPVSVEAQLLAAFDDVPGRTTANVCTPGTHIMMQGQLITDHCVNSDMLAPRAGEWVDFEADVKADEFVKLYINEKLAFHLTKPQLDIADKNAQALNASDTALTSGYIALQSESHPVEFKNIRLLNRAKS